MSTSPLRYSDFDVLGVIKLKPDEVSDQLIPFLTPVYNGDQVDHYLSRGEKYYQAGLTYTDRAQEYEYLKSIFPHDDPTSKEAFVVAEHMANHSARIFFSEMIKQIFLKDNNHFEQIRSTFIKDCAMVRSILRGEETVCHTDHLPTGSWTTESRQIELDNKALLDIFARSIEIGDPASTLVLTPGFGSVYVGPFMHLENYGVEFENLYLSAYAKGKSTADSLVQNLFKDTGKPLKDMLKDGNLDITQLMTNGQNYFNQPKTNCLVLDDNMGTGNTAAIIVQAVERDLGIHNCTQMAAMNNWVNFAKVKFGNDLLSQNLSSEQKENIDNHLSTLQSILDRHNTDSNMLTRTDIVNPDISSNPNIFQSPINFPDYKLLKRAISCLQQGNGNEYDDVMTRYGYGSVKQGDLTTCIEIADQAKELVSDALDSAVSAPNLQATASNISTMVKIVSDTKVDIPEPQQPDSQE
ncbi:MAG: hypothetical protein IJD48_03425 [Clostridia bacterium]|nr:hypothetical protein [Clostridia bacterium]